MSSIAENQAEVGLCLLIANADGEISDEEIAELRAKIREHDKDTSDAVLDVLIEKERGAMDDKGADAYLANLVERIPQDRREAALRTAVDVAFADMLTSEEDKFVRKVATAFGIAASVVDEIAGPAI